MSTDNIQSEFVMEARSYFALGLLIIQIVFSEQWTTTVEDQKPVKVRKAISEHTKHLSEAKRWAPSRELRKKPSGHLTPLKPDDMDSDGVVSVAVGPPPVRPKFDKTMWRRPHKNHTASVPRPLNTNAVNFVRDVLTQLGREFLSNQVNEDFVFGQYVGSAMKNLTSEIKLKMQHDILDIIVKYQRLNSGDVIKEDNKQKEEDKPLPLGLKFVKSDKNNSSNHETEEPWPDFSNLAKIVG